MQIPPVLNSHRLFAPLSNEDYENDATVPMYQGLRYFFCAYCLNADIFAGIVSFMVFGRR